MEAISMKAAWKVGLQSFTKRPLVIVATSIIFASAAFFTSQYFPLQNETGVIEWSSTSVLLKILLQVVIVFLEVYAAVILSLAIHDGTSVSNIKDWKLERFVPFVPFLFLYYLGLALGFALLVIPGLIFLVTFGFSMYVIVEKKSGVIASFKESARLAKGIRWRLLLFNVLILLLMVAVPLSFAVLAGLWSLMLHIPINEVLIEFGAMVVTYAVMLAWIVAYASIYRQLLAAKSTE